MDPELKHALGIIEKFKRTAYLPIVAQNQNSFSAQSKIGGFPYLRNTNDWPVCPNCKKHMQLFLQLNLDQLPERKQDGLIQLYYCTTTTPLCESDLNAAFPFSTGAHCRKISVAGESATIKPMLDTIFPEKEITGWNPVEDYPHYAEFHRLGLDSDTADEIIEILEENEVGLPIVKDKLFGWPAWVQSMEYPNDRKTQTQMELLFQLASEENLPYMFGDAGIGYLSQSKDNHDELAFGWACS